MMQDTPGINDIKIFELRNERLIQHGNLGDLPMGRVMGFLMHVLAALDGKRVDINAHDSLGPQLEGPVRKQAASATNIEE